MAVPGDKPGSQPWIICLDLTNRCHVWRRRRGEEGNVISRIQFCVWLGSISPWFIAFGIILQHPGPAASEHFRHYLIAICRGMERFPKVRQPLPAWNRRDSRSHSSGTCSSPSAGGSRGCSHLSAEGTGSRMLLLQVPRSSELPGTPPTESFHGLRIYLRCLLPIFFFSAPVLTPFTSPHNSQFLTQESWKTPQACAVLDGA